MKINGVQNVLVVFAKVTDHHFFGFDYRIRYKIANLPAIGIWTIWKFF